MPGVSRRAAGLLALALLGVLQAAWFLSSAPIALKAGVAGLLALSMARPGVAVMVWAGLAPFSSSLAMLAGSLLSGAVLLEHMTLAVITGVVARGSAGTTTRLGLPALVMGTIALVSGLAELPARLITSAPEPLSPLAIGQLLFQHAVDRIPALDPWYFALVIAEGAALAWAAESLVRRDADLAPRVIWCALLGHAGVGVLNITRIISASLRGGEFPASLPGLFVSIRAHTQYDVNAAASILVMVILAAIGLTSRRARIPLFLTIGVVAVALWVAGSRVAMVALLITLAAMLVLRTRHSGKTVVVAACAVVVSAGLIGWISVGYPTNRNLNLPNSIASRAILFKAAARMARHAPVVGVGTGTFLEESPFYGAWAIHSYVYDSRTRDNAHNYFLQTLAEQGVIGLLALLGVLGAALVPAMRAAPRRDVLTKWLAGGIVASILTWMTGHPLLIPEAAFVFWLFVGLLAGMSVPPATSPAAKRIAALAIVALLASLPVRAARGTREADLEHFATGVSPWQAAVDGERYRVAGPAFSLFLPAGQTMVLPMRTSAPSPVTIHLSLNQRPIDAVVAEPEGWRQYRIHVPENEARFVKVDFRVEPAASCQSCVWVGKAVPVR
jgi:hypothetical protein